MTKSEATAEVFVMVFKALSKRERDAVVMRLIEDKNFREDLLDIALSQERLNEPTRPLKNALNEIAQWIKGKNR